MNVPSPLSAPDGGEGVLQQVTLERAGVGQRVSPHVEELPGAAEPHAQSVLQRPVEVAQYGSRAFIDLCDELGDIHSMGAVGTSADNNAPCESFHAPLKRETLQGARDHGGASTCRKRVFAWLRVVP
ncbi:hypothetical protein [Streptomyces apricus]|uniref:Transposase n=1 Tax=Streptomyces apricus TaxID=1828112 RepID=A0A5B0A018_9ACTN|nr:hypothetical protein FGF04_33705 [Streptomyces apricus]